MEDKIKTIKILGSGCSNCQKLEANAKQAVQELNLSNVQVEYLAYLASEIAALAKELHPDEIQINTPLRPCGVKHLSPEELSKIKQHFHGFRNVFTVYEAQKPDVVPFNFKETTSRRPKF
jgi:wyosine [tRNA(Phe)-imidazoG37] synthetase (radical SAM superfamily)